MKPERVATVVAVIVLATVGVVAPLGLVVLVPLMSAGSGALDGSSSGGGVGGDACMGTISGGAVKGGSLNNRQKKLVTTIVTVVKRDKLPDTAAVIAIMTAKQESDLGADPASRQPNGDGDAGPFQQRVLPGWYGTLDEINNDAYATEAFLKGHTIAYAGAGSAGGPGYHIPGLVDIDGWQTMSLTAAAQAVQGSAYPDAYAKWEPMARQLIGATTAGTLGGCTTGSADEKGVSKNLAEAVEWAKGIAADDSYAYVWGGNGKADGGYDCSGLTSALYKRIGVNLPRTAAEQQKVGTPVTRDQLKVGDLIFWGTPAYHVATYIGGGQMVSADNHVRGINVEKIYGNPSNYRRIVTGGGQTAGANNPARDANTEKNYGNPSD